MNDIVVSNVEDSNQSIVVLAGDDYVAAVVKYWVSEAEKSDEPDPVVLLCPVVALRLACALCKASLMSRLAFVFNIFGATWGVGQ